MRLYLVTSENLSISYNDNLARTVDILLKQQLEIIISSIININQVTLKDAVKYFNKLELRNIENMFSISIRNYHDAKKKIKSFTCTLIINVYILFGRTVIMSTSRASSAFLSSHRNTVLTQSAQCLIDP